MILNLVQENPFLSLISILTVLVVSLITKVFYTGDKRFHELSKVIPGPKQSPLIGNSFELLGSASGNALFIYYYT